MKNFDQHFREEFLDLLTWRRDVRHFKTDPLPDGKMEELINYANMAPSVGLSQPWRFVEVSSSESRAKVLKVFESENDKALNDYHGEKAKLYASLKLSGMKEAPIQLAVYCDPDPEKGAGLGRKTMPETLAYSCTMAIHTMWLAARAQGIGLGWVSIIDPDKINTILDVPADWQLIGYFCIGYPVYVDDKPELERKGWEAREAPVILRK
ncbi:5,6-dimethylbenzimidazole synthase [Curvivirga aplysinae]|uniref:5,6-dimethylbenzimidazole synthase n=1 Tax=Curvivirga aplysinae TaxID=2529852 RepID=UPI0012BC2512|nr:5,6-dimethylbenzimidazole synthase [Curvivirga aplysinae]MTI09450.1 5,6-dimethylbenzimidazole synthase [Curvivirga aplysinae]